MPPERDPHFKAAFVELHRRQCEAAPALEAMLNRAQGVAGARRRPIARPRLALAAAGWCLTLCALWSLRGGRPPQASPTASAQRVEQLLAAIEQQLDSRTEPAFEFPTDLLLTQNQTDLSP